MPTGIGSLPWASVYANGMACFIEIYAAMARILQTWTRLEISKLRLIFNAEHRLPECT